MAQSRDFDSAARLPGHFSGDAVILVADPKSIGEEVRDGIPQGIDDSPICWFQLYWKRIGPPGQQANRQPATRNPEPGGKTMHPA